MYISKSLRSLFIAFIEYFSKVPRLVVALISALSIITIAFVDYLTGFEISLSIFYLPPIMFAAWFAGTGAAAFIILLSIVSWLYADIASGLRFSSSLILAWEAAMRLGFFFLTAFFLNTIKHMLEHEKSMARTDFLTSAANSRYFYETVEHELSRAKRFQRPLTVAYIDIDNFKLVNDRLGHAAGDDLLRRVADTLKEHMRSFDMVARLGGDEFALLMPETDEANARSAVEKTRRVLMDTMRDNGWDVTFSIGIITCIDEACSVSELMHSADQMMYSVKKGGKDGMEVRSIGGRDYR